MAKRGRPTKNKVSIRRRVPPPTVTPGYDAICGFCGEPFTILNSIYCGAERPEKFCTQGCQDAARESGNG